MKAAPGATAPPRQQRLDALRGAAVVWMAVFHFCFDLNALRLLTPIQAFTRDPFWTTQRSCIVSLFLLCAGLAQALALAGRASDHSSAVARPSGWALACVRTFDRSFWRRWGQVAGCALLVSVGSWWVYPNSFIYFGVLHGLAVMLLLLRLVWLASMLALPQRPGARAGAWLALALGALLAPALLAHTAFDSGAWQALGLMTRKPVTEDYVPLLPWLGVVLAGLALGQWLLRHRPQALAGPLPRACRPLAWLGRHALGFYILHQPLLFGGLMAGRSQGWW